MKCDIEALRELEKIAPHLLTPEDLAALRYHAPGHVESVQRRSWAGAALCGLALAGLVWWLK